MFLGPGPVSQPHGAAAPEHALQLRVVPKASWHAEQAARGGAVVPLGGVLRRSEPADGTFLLPFSAQTLPHIKA